MTNFFITSPLDQFEVQSIFTLTSPFLGFFSISITTFSLFALITPYLVIAYHYYADNEYHLIPSRWSISVEAMYASINGIVKEQLGREEYLPLIYSLFFFVLFSNLVGNIPYTYTLGTSIIASIGLSFTILVAVTILGISIHKVHFASFFVPQGTPLVLVPVLVLIELVSYLARAFSLGIRLFANMTAGHSLLAILSGFLYKLFLGNGIIVSILTLLPFALFLCIVGLELAVSFIQAYVFCLLTTSYIKDAIDLH